MKLLNKDGTPVKPIDKKASLKRADKFFKKMGWEYKNPIK